MDYHPDPSIEIEVKKEQNISPNLKLWELR